MNSRHSNMLCGMMGTRSTHAVMALMPMTESAANTVAEINHGNKVNLPLFDVPLSHFIMRPS